MSDSDKLKVLQKFNVFDDELNDVEYGKTFAFDINENGIEHMYEIDGFYFSEEPDDGYTTLEDLVAMAGIEKYLNVGNLMTLLGTTIQTSCNKCRCEVGKGEMRLEPILLMTPICEKCYIEKMQSILYTSPITTTEMDIEQVEKVDV